MLASAGAGSARTAADEVVSRVTVLVEGRPAGPELQGTIPINPGDRYSPDFVNRVISNVYQTGIFSDIKVSKTGEGDKVELTFELTRNLFLRRIRFEGFPARRSRLLEALESLREGEVLVESRLARAVEELRRELVRRGYFDAMIDARVNRLPEARADVVFTARGWKRYRVGSLEFSGDLVLPRPDVEKKVRTAAGRFYLPMELEQDVQRLTAFYAANGFRRADIHVEKEAFNVAEKTVDIELKVATNEKITIITNGTRVPAGLLAPIWEERVFEEWGLAEGEARLLNYFRKKGYIFAAVKGRLERAENEIRVVYDIEPGRKYTIERIDIEGAAAFTPERIKKQVALVERTLFFSLLSYDRIFALPRDIEDFYRENGYQDVRAGLELEKRGASVVARVRIEEGVKQTVNRVDVEGVGLFPVDEVRRELRVLAGDPYFAPSVQRDAERVESFYLNRGVRGTRVTARVEKLDTGSVSVVYEVAEGRRYDISNILITGNRRTRLKVITKELLVKKGGPADFSLVRESERRLDKLGVFSEVSLEEVPAAENDLLLLVRVREGQQNSASVGVGFETREDVRSIALWSNTFRPRGTLEYVRGNVFGLAAQVSVVAQYGQFEKRLITSWHQPYLLGLPLQPSIIGWLESEDRESFAYERRGFSLGTVSPVRRYLSLLTTLRWTRTRLTKLEIEESEIDRELRPYSTALGSVSIIYDRRDDIFNPSRGFFFSVVAEAASPVFGTESDYLKTFLKMQWFKPIAPLIGLGVTARTGLGSGRISIPERFFAGGSNSFRGEEFDRLGPKDPVTDKPVGGKALLLINTELKFPILPALKDVSGVAFVDVGNVFPEISSFRLTELEAAAGAGIRYRTPLGPLRFELAWKLFDRTRRKPLFFFTIGNVF